jgi:hypothetical protein
MRVKDRLRQFSFLAIFGWFSYYTAIYADFNPYPKELGERHKAMWDASGVSSSDLIDGDLVLRHSKGFVSDAILTFSTEDPQFSHSGIVKKENGKAYVYHATGGEENVTNEMKKDPLSIYCHPAAVFKFGIFRYDLTDAQRAKFVSILDANYAKGVEFDLDFDMYTDEQMYCSEMIYKALTEVMDGENFIELSHAGEKPYVAIDDLYLNNKTRELIRYDYNKASQANSGGLTVQ